MNVDDIDLRIAAILRDMDRMRTELQELRVLRAQLQQGPSTSGTLPTFRAVRDEDPLDDDVRPLEDEAPTVAAKTNRNR